jgi:hypothetical protein
MSAYFDVRFKHPWDFRGYSGTERVAFNALTGFKHFCVGVNPDRSFNFLRIHDDEGRVKMENELSSLSYASLAALILWRLSTPITVLNSMAMACLGLREDPVRELTPPTVFRARVDDDAFTLSLEALPVPAFRAGPLCLMLIAQHADRACSGPPDRREVLLYTPA